MEESKRRRVRLAAIVIGALVLIGVVTYEQRKPVHVVPEDAAAAQRLLAAHGRRADFAPASLWDVDRFLEDGAPGEGTREVKLRELGAYAGEVIRRAKGGSWVAAPSAPAGVELELEGGTRCSPHARVARRIEAGRAESVAFYAQSLGVDVRPVPDWALATTAPVSSSDRR